MIQALRSLGHNQFEYAKWYAEKEHYKLIQVAIVSENEKQWNTVVQGLITTNDSTILKTSYAYSYEKRQHIFYRDGWWEIRNIGERSLEINPQSMRLVNPNLNKEVYLEVVKVNGYDV